MFHVISSVGKSKPMNKPLKWGLGFLFGLSIVNLFWLHGLESPTAMPLFWRSYLSPAQESFF